MDQRLREQAFEMLAQSQRSENPFQRQALINDAMMLISPSRRVAAGVEPHNTIECDPTHPPITGPFVEPLLAPNQYLVLENTPIVAPETTSARVRLEFSSGAGWLIGWRGVAVDNTIGAGAAGDFEQASMGLEFIINDSQALITNGNAQDFATFYELFDRDGMTPILRYVNSKDQAFFRFQNFQLAGGSDLRPRLTFAFLRDPRWC